MLPVLEKLLILQERDEKFAQIQEELARIPAEEAALEQKRLAASQRLEAVRASLKHLEVDRKKLDLDATAKRDQIGRYKTQQLMTRNNDEFTALNHQIEHAEKEIVAIEDAELGVMERSSEMEKQVVAEQASLQLQEAALAKQKAVFEERRVRLAAEIVRVKEQQAAAEAEVEATQEGILSRYRRIFQSKKKQAVVGVSHGACGGCHMRLTPNTLVAVRGKEVVACESCGRLIYWIE